MFERKLMNLFYNAKKIHLIWLAWLVAFVFSSATCTFAAWPWSSNPRESKAEVPESISAELNLVEKSFGLIYQGKFNAAEELIQHQSGVSPEPNQDSHPLLGQLAQTIQEYKQIHQQRLSAREAAYKKQLADLEKFRSAEDINDINDANDANDLSSVLAVIAQASEFADQNQKSELLSGPFVKQVFQKAIDEATEFEANGKWLDAYINCYIWLQTSDPNNEAYSDYAEQLKEKATIAASFQDSPCESSSERYEGIKKKMFISAIDLLNTAYVSTVDYSQMAAKAIKRCKLLAEVLAVSSSQNSQDEPEKIPLSPPDPNELAAWSATMTVLLDEVEHSPTGFNKKDFIDVYEKILALNETTVELPQPLLIAQFADAALSALDPYTSMIWPKQVQDFEKEMTNKFTGIGVEITKEKGLLTIASLLLDTPAFHSGLDAGDVVEAVDGVETKDMTLICAVRKITGTEGTKVTLTIKRPGEEKTRDITITRASITVPTVRGWQRTAEGKWFYMIDQQNKIGYVRITSLSSTEAASDFEKVLNELEEKGLKGLVLDLRFNSGGFLDIAVQIADKFLEKGLIVRTQPGFGRIPIYEPAHKKGTHSDYPIVILINSITASGAEIIAGALADEKHNRAILVGERTYGKGTVLGVMPLSRGGPQLKYTIANYHLPSGQRVKSRDDAEKQGKKDWGIGPDIEIKLRSDELREMFRIRKDNDVLVQANHNEGGTAQKRHTAEETIAADPQLAVGLLIVKAKLAETGALISHAN